MLRTLCLSFIFMLCLSACGGDSTDNADNTAGDESVRFNVQGEKAIMNGVIDGSLQDKLLTMLANNPGVNTIEMQNVPGSDNDDANLVASRIVRERGLHTHVPANGLIASGGVDFYLAGAMRTLGDGALVGVHSWADGDDRAGSSFPMNDPEHKKYLDYYTEMGIPLTFYWFTLEAAGPAEIHYMTAEEIARYSITTN